MSDPYLLLKSASGYNMPALSGDTSGVTDSLEPTLQTYWSTGEHCCLTNRTCTVAIIYSPTKK